MSDRDDLKERVRQFEELSLPGQPTMMHMGTAYLVRDLWEEVKRLREQESRTPRCAACGGYGEIKLPGNRSGYEVCDACAGKGF